MAHFYGMLKLGNPDAWKGLAGEDRWKPTRSAYELAYAWQGSGGIPTALRDALSDSGVAHLSGLKLEVAFVEKPTFLDTAIGPSMTDIMGYARNRSGSPVILGIEGKATEPFGLPVHAWIRGDIALPPPEADPRPSRIRRLEYLAQRLGISADADSTLQYQLLHRTVSTVMEAALHGAECAVLVVHCFAEEDQQNWQAFVQFLAALGVSSPERNRVTCPLSVPGDIPLYAIWFKDKPRAPAT
jgi:hypothetical protein